MNKWLRIISAFFGAIGVVYIVDEIRASVGPLYRYFITPQPYVLFTSPGIVNSKDKLMLKQWLLDLFYQKYAVMPFSRDPSFDIIYIIPTEQIMRLHFDRFNHYYNETLNRFVFSLSFVDFLDLGFPRPLNETEAMIIDQLHDDTTFGEDVGKMFSHHC